MGALIAMAGLVLGVLVAIYMDLGRIISLLQQIAANTKK